MEGYTSNGRTKNIDFYYMYKTSLTFLYYIVTYIYMSLQLHISYNSSILGQLNLTIFSTDSSIRILQSTYLVDDPDLGGWENESLVL